MARAKRLSDVRRVLLRKLAVADESAVESLRDELWDVLLMRQFMRGNSVEWLAQCQPNRNDRKVIEGALRRRFRKG